jgi:hypothetical protein
MNVLLPKRRNDARRSVPAAMPPPLSKLKAAISRMEGNQGPSGGQAYSRPPQQEHGRGSARWLRGGIMYHPSPAMVCKRLREVMVSSGLWHMQGGAVSGSVQGNKPCASIPAAEQRLGLWQACCTISACLSPVSLCSDGLSEAQR